MTTEQSTPNDRLFLQDEQGNYYVLTREMLESIKVPAENKGEVEDVIRGNIEVEGFAFQNYAATQPVRLNAFGSNLSVAGKCNGACARSFGVLNKAQFGR